MKLKVWSLIALVLIAFTLATCTLNSRNLESSEQTLPAQNTEISDTANEGKTNDPSSVSDQKPTDCRVSLFESGNSISALTCGGAYDFEEEKLLINDEPKTGRPLFFHKDVLQTKDTEAELVFNTLDMAKANVETNFQFEEGSRASELQDLGVVPKGGKFPLTIGDILISAGRTDLQSNELNQADVNNDSASNSQIGGISQFRDTNSEASLFRVSINEMDIASSAGVYVVKRDERQINVNNDSASNSQTGGISQSRDTNSEAPLIGVSTDEMDIASSAGVYVVKRDERQKRTQIFNLSREEIRVADNRKVVQVVGKSQTIVANQDGFLGDPFEFPICSFYTENEEFLEGLRPNDENFVNAKQKPVQVAYDIARSMTAPVYHERCQRRCPIPSVY